MVRFYAQGAPSWWPYHVVTVSQPELPQGARPESVVVDNNAFNFYRKGVFPPLDMWCARIARVASRASSVAGEVIVVLPDYPLEPLHTIGWAKRAKWLCKHYRCMAVMHYDMLHLDWLEHVFESYVYDIDADLYGLPLKLPLSKGYNTVARRVTVDAKLQLLVVERASKVVGHDKLHLLAPSTKTIVSLWRYARSFDTTSWTRAVDSRLKRLLGTISARSRREREIMFAWYVKTLTDSGVKIEGAELALEFLTSDVGWPKLNYTRREPASNRPFTLERWLGIVSVGWKP